MMDKAQKLPFAILPDEMKALERFHECATDGEGYDVSKAMMRRLAEIGLLRRVTANYYEHTTFGLSVLNGDFAAASSAPVEQAAPSEVQRIAFERLRAAVGLTECDETVLMLNAAVRIERLTAELSQAAPVTVTNGWLAEAAELYKKVAVFPETRKEGITDLLALRNHVASLLAAAPAPSADAQDAKRLTVSEGGVDWLGLALDLEQQSKRTESKTAMRVMNAAAHGLRLMGAASVSKDAARYRWLRARQWNDSDLCVVTNPKEAVKLGHDCPSLERLDETIDAALSAQKEGGGNADQA